MGYRLLGVVKNWREGMEVFAGFSLGKISSIFMLVRCNLSAHFPAKEKVPDEISGISTIFR